MNLIQKGPIQQGLVLNNHENQRHMITFHKTKKTGNIFFGKRWKKGRIQCVSWWTATGQIWTGSHTTTSGKLCNIGTPWDQSLLLYFRFGEAQKHIKTFNNDDVLMFPNLHQTQNPHKYPSKFYLLISLWALALVSLSLALWAHLGPSHPMDR